MKSDVNNTEGFTLIEIITVIVVLSILGGFSYRFLDSAIETYGMAKKQGTLHQDGVLILERISRELNDAVSVTRPGVGVSSVNNELSFSKQHTLSDGVLSVSFVRNTTNNKISRNGVLLGQDIDTFRVERYERGTTTECDDYFVIFVRLSNGSQNVSMSMAVRPKNVMGSYSDRCFNGNYEDTVK